MTFFSLVKGYYQRLAFNHLQLLTKCSITPLDMLLISLSFRLLTEGRLVRGFVHFFRNCPISFP